MGPQYYGMKSETLEELLKFCLAERAIVEIHHSAEDFNENLPPIAVSIDIPCKEMNQDEWLDFKFKLAKWLQRR